KDAIHRNFYSAALYFWYRVSPDWIIPDDLVGLVTPGNPPAELPGMVTTKWDGSGRLLYLKAVPSGVQTSTASTAELWKRLFAAAGLHLAEFTPIHSDWIAAPGWDERSTWTGTYPDAKRTAVRVEAAAWRGSAVYFEVLTPRMIARRS